MVPVTINVIGRVLAQTFVFVFAPLIGLIGLLGKLLTTLTMTFILVPSGWSFLPGGTASWAFTVFAGLVTPIYYSASRLALS